MFVITNRVLNPRLKNLDAFGMEPNPAGPTELRFAEVRKVSSGYEVEILENQLSRAEVDQLMKDYPLKIDPEKPWYSSLKVACELYDKARKEERDILFFVHGYNNDIKDVFRTAMELEKLYNLIVVPFSWPANGRTADYLSDKDDARTSATALHRAVQKIQFYHRLMTESARLCHMETANKRFPDNAEKANALFMKLMAKECTITINMLCHSMGNYLLKYATLPGSSSLRELVFDNIALIAADANNPDHDEWLQCLQTRNRIYVVINENDGALGWSRRKPGDEQKPRLGAHLRNLNANNAYYIDVTRCKGVNTEHSYFKGATVNDNAQLKKIFARIFQGENAETQLTYHSDINVYRT